MGNEEVWQRCSEVYDYVWNRGAGQETPELDKVFNRLFDSYFADDSYEIMDACVEGMRISPDGFYVMCQPEWCRLLYSTDWGGQLQTQVLGDVVDYQYKYLRSLDGLK